VAPRHSGLLAALAAIWGGSYLLIKYGLEDLEPAMIVWLRCALAAVVLYVYLRVSRGGTDARRALADLRARPKQAAILAGISVALPFLLITFGELEVPSGLTAVLIAPASLFVAAFAPFIDASEKVARRAVGGMLLALAGVALLIGIESVHSLGEFLGSLAILGSAACYALGSFVVKGRYKGMPARGDLADLHDRHDGAGGARRAAHRTGPAARPARRPRRRRPRRGGHRAGLRHLLQAHRRDRRGKGVARVLSRAGRRALRTARCSTTSP
jgi:uncharacterized membrane protein